MTKNKSAKSLLEIINEAITEKKGINLINIDMKNIENAVTRHFVICHASSDIQVKSIAGFIEKQTKENCSEKPYLKEGYDNAQWILLDYFDVIVHVFQKEYRSFYNLEELWADGIVRQIGDDGKIIDKQ